MKSIEKKRAVELRRKGKSLNEISKLLKVAKSSVSVWVRNVILTEKEKRKLFLNSWTREAIEKRRDARLKNENARRRKIIEEAETEIKKISDKELFIIGVILYWAEGGKTKRGLVRLANSDPNLIKIAMCFFRDICQVREEKFRAHIHTHSHINVNKALMYWSNITSIPQSQFYKTYSKPSVASKNKKDSLPYGTVDIVICDTTLFLKIVGWTRKINKLILGHEYIEMKDNF